MAELDGFLDRPSWEVAPELLGWRFETRFGGVTTAVVLNEVEAYDQVDPASHSFRGQTPRTAPMFGPAGGIYVYRSYGLHWCVNIVTGPAGHGAAVLLRGGTPVAGVNEMKRRRGRSDHISDGPGKLTQALGIDGSHTGTNLNGLTQMRLTPTGDSPSWVATPRIGITRATDTLWRFVHVST